MAKHLPGNDGITGRFRRCRRLQRSSLRGKHGAEESFLTAQSRLRRISKVQRSPCRCMHPWPRNIGTRVLRYRQVLEKWSGQQDSNLRPSGPKPDALPGCAIPRSVDFAGFIFVRGFRQAGTDGKNGVMWTSTRRYGRGRSFSRFWPAWVPQNRDATAPFALTGWRPCRQWQCPVFWRCRHSVQAQIWPACVRG